MVEVRDKALDIVKKQGPIIPSKIASELNMNLLFASAVLSELSASGLVKVSNIKVGGSPLYYLEEQKEKLQEYAKRLHEKEKRTFDELKQKKLMRDSELDLLHKVTLRNIKDFAIPLEITVGNETELFWKWYLASEDEIKSILDAIFVPEKKKEQKKEQMIEQKQEHEDHQEAQKTLTEKAADVSDSKLENKFEKSKKKSIRKKKKDQDISQETISEAIVQKDAEKNPENMKKEEVKEKKSKQESSDFMNLVNDYFKQNNIEIIESIIVKKGAEFDLILNIPSTVGKVKYYCKARKKLKIDENDLSSAYVQGEFKKLPVLYLTTGQFTKKATEMLDKEFKSIAAKQLK